MTITAENKVIIACVTLGVLGFALFMGMPIAAEAMYSDLGFADDLIGYMASAEYGGMFLASLITAALLTRMDRRLLTGLGILLAVSCGLLSLYARDFYTLLPLRLMSGIGSGIGYSVAVAVLSGTRDTTRNFTYFIFAQVVANAIVLYAFPSLSYRWGINGIYAAYIFVFTLGLIPLYWLPRFSSQPAGDKAKTFRAALRGVPTAIPLLCLVGIFGFYAMISIYWVYVYLLGIDLNYAVDSLNVIMAALTLLSLVACWLALVISRRFGQFRPLLGALFALELILLINVAGITIPTYFLGMIGIFFFWNFIDIYQLATIAQIDHSGRFVAMVPGAQGLAMAVGPAFAGFMLGEPGDHHTMMKLLAGLTMLSILAYSIVFLYLNGKMGSE